ncbi:MAG: bifunctional homocysteine S-methyltransferase/methylenetetrahydrofolate reductase [Alphaproteobacteria bacterium]|nr:bifunctional homocysteine S-methyltransferase/methylenetetrahydrofolate reductase [Alphaproteobacteria bacterium]MCB9797618.1 bifunctional homocysteine S-methyltransferase/methylenetetrahydrofolate reductase [Alphaproteobacteria bacterium]
MDLLASLGQRVLFLDGALGTEFYARGVFINRSYDELNVIQPELVRKVHEDYVRAGADLITANTFGANRVRLQPFGLEQRAEEIARAGVRLARQATRGRAAVLGSIGPTGAQLRPVGRLSPGSAYHAFRDQAEVMADEGIDAFLLETFTSLPELWQAVRAVKDGAPGVPILTCMSFNFEPDGTQVEGEDPEEAARVMSGWGVAGLGVNCSNGPQVVLSVLERMAKVTDKPLIAYPNAGQPQVVEGRTLYLAAPEYMAEYARRMVQKGASVVGGCCGTTPAMLKEMRSFVRSVTPGMREVVEPVEEAEGVDADPLEEVPVEERSEFARKISAGEFVISVELDPPRGLDPSRALEGAEFLRARGIDVINIADGPRAVARMGPMALAQLARQRCGIESVIHYCCRDRNLLGMQMDLLGAHALGLHNVLAVTGDPPKMGTYPNATAVFDIDSIGLLHFITRMNRGLDFSGRPMGGRTQFFVGAGCNPAHVELEREVERFGKKIEAGAKFFFSQPVYDPDVLQRFLDMTERFPKVPFLVGILPLASYKNAEFLHNEVPGMQVPQEIRDRLKAAPTRKDQRRIGIEVARQTLAEVYEHPRIQGAYIYPPFGSYPAVMKVVEALPRFADAAKDAG